MAVVVMKPAREQEKEPKSYGRPQDQVLTAAFINCASEADLLTETCGVALTGNGCGVYETPMAW